MGLTGKISVIKSGMAAIAGIPTFKYMITYAIILYKLSAGITADIPVPIFFFFHLDQFLSNLNTCFSEGSEAGGGNPVLKGEKRLPIWILK